MAVGQFGLASSSMEVIGSQVRPPPTVIASTSVRVVLYVVPEGSREGLPLPLEGLEARETKAEEWQCIE